MKYLEDMEEKYGFNDGSMIPEEAWEFRTLYVQAFNKVAELKGFSVRMEEWNRAGIHNTCLVSYTNPNQQEQYAICSILNDMNIDEFVITKSNVDPRWSDELERTVKEGDEQ